MFETYRPSHTLDSAWLGFGDLGQSVDSVEVQSHSCLLHELRGCMQLHGTHAMERALVQAKVAWRSCFCGGLHSRHHLEKVLESIQSYYRRGTWGSGLCRSGTDGDHVHRFVAMIFSKVSAIFAHSSRLFGDHGPPRIARNSAQRYR